MNLRTGARGLLAGRGSKRNAGAVAAALACVALLASAGVGGADRSAQPETGEEVGRRFGGDRFFTMPSKDAEIGFQISTQVTEVVVKGGQVVKEGALLVRGDDAEEVALVEIQRQRSETNLPVRRAEEQAELAKVEYELQVQAQQQGGATETEVNRSRVNLRIAELDVDQAKENASQEALQLARLEARLTRFRLTAPFDGRVDSVVVVRGDTVGEGQPVVRVVQIDPLFIDVHAPVAETMTKGLREGDKAWALVDVPGGAKVLEGKIIEVSPVAQFASRKRRVRVEVSNPEGWPPGLAAWVRFEEPGAAWDAYRLEMPEAGADDGAGS
ncbi:MAG: efflux RND transporter periplasmic adaptor subunit [Phycisphaerales bacterium JB037]